MKRSQITKIRFPKTKVVGKRDWGKEELLALIPKKNFFKKNFYKKRKERWTSISS